MPFIWVYSIIKHLFFLVLAPQKDAGVQRRQSFWGLVMPIPKRITDRREVILENKKATRLGSLLNIYIYSEQLLLHSYSREIHCLN